MEENKVCFDIFCHLCLLMSSTRKFSREELHYYLQKNRSKSML